MNDAWQPLPTRFEPADLTHTMRTHSFGATVSELIAEARLPSDVEWDSIPSRASEGAILVTGGSGFLGTRVVASHLGSGDPSPILVVSRRPESIRSALVDLVGPIEGEAMAHDPRLSTMALDLAMPDAVRRVQERMCGVPIRTIMHLAAAIDAFSPRRRMTAANEDATRTMASLAARTGARLVHASTLSLFVSSDAGGESQETSIRENPERTLYGGYAQTKAVADMIVEKARGRGLDAVSVRLGLLVPEAGRHMDETSFLSIFARGLRTVGCVPRDAEDATVDLTPVDQAAQALHAIARWDDPPSIVHYANPVGTHLSMMVHAILGKRVDTVARGVWEARVSSLKAIPATLLESAFHKSRFLRGRCVTRPLVNVDLFQSTGRSYDVDVAIGMGAPRPRSPSGILASVFEGSIGPSDGHHAKGTSIGEEQGSGDRNAEWSASRRESKGTKMAYTYQQTDGDTEVYDENDPNATVLVLVTSIPGETDDHHLERVRTVVESLNAGGSITPAIARNVDRLRVLARRAIAANAIVAATNVSDLEDDGSIFEEIHDKANDLTIDTQRAFARELGWLAGSDDMADGISPTGQDLFDQMTHGGASDEDISRAFLVATGEEFAAPSRNDAANLMTVTDDKGFITLHEPDEDGRPGDLVASVWRDDWLPSIQAAKPPVRI